MGIDRKLWLSGFSEGDVPPWPCPKCGKGVLHLKGTPRDDNQKKMNFPIIERRDAQTSRDMHRASWHPMEDGGVFAAILQCNRDPCGEVVSVSGSWSNDQEYDEEDGGTKYISVYNIVCMYPAPPIFQVPENCPKPIKDELKDAFDLYWFDTGSCLNSIRTAIEIFLTGLGIKRFGVNKKGKKYRHSLSERIDLLPPPQAALKTTLNAIRWLGNVGSHSGKSTREDALDGFELLHHVLEEKYVQHRKVITKMSNEIIRRRGPRKPKN